MLTPKEPRPKFVIDPEKLRKIQEEYETKQKLVALTIRLQQQKDLCCIVLGTALMKLHSSYELSWRDMARELGSTATANHLYRLAHRRVGASETFYNQMAKSINRYIHDKGGETIDFPTFSGELRETTVTDGV